MSRGHARPFNPPLREMRKKEKVKRGDPNIIHRRGKTRFDKVLYGECRAYAGRYREAL